MADHRQIVDTSGKGGHPIFAQEHDELRETLRRFVANELRPHADEWERTTFPDWVFPRLGELGFLGLDKPEEYGGQGGDYFTAIVLAEELVRSRSFGMAMGVNVHTDMAMPPIVLFGTEAQKQEWLVPAIAGEKVLCLGISEPDAGSDVAGIKTTAVRDGDDFVINGSKTYITNGHRADVIVLVTKTDPGAGHQGFTLFLVPMDADGVIREKRLDKVGMHASDTALLAFQDVRVGPTAVLGEVGLGFRHIMWELQGERLINAASWVAAAQDCLEQTLVFASERRAFGRTIDDFQAIRHRLAEMATDIEAARQLVYTSAWNLGQGGYPVREISMAKLKAARTVCQVADECLQIHGGAGYMTEYGIERIWRDMRLSRIGGGSDEIMLEVISKSLI